MTLLHDAYTALLAGLTHKAGDEIHWHDNYGHPITVEPVDVDTERCVVRRYSNGSLHCENDYLQGQKHGKHRGWHYNGQLWWETDYTKDQRHGKSVWWHKNGQKEREVNYVNGQFHGKCIKWYKSGKKKCEKDYHQGNLHGKNIGWFEDGTFWQLTRQEYRVV